MATPPELHTSQPLYSAETPRVMCLAYAWITVRPLSSMISSGGVVIPDVACTGSVVPACVTLLASALELTPTDGAQQPAG